MQKKIAVLPGDGIGTEVTRGAVEILKAVADRYGHDFQFEYGLIGGTAIDQTGNPLPEDTISLCKDSDAVLLGAVGGPKWDSNPSHLRPEKGLLGIRKQLNLYANLRPISFYASLSEASPLRKEIIQDADFMIVRELTGGLYFGKPSGRTMESGQETVVDTLLYHRYEIKRIIELAFSLAEQRRGKVTSVDKANVLESSKLWREVAEEVSKDYPNVALEHMLVDNAAMQLIRNPRQFDVVVTENMFGDILSDEASVLTGSLGMLPSASISSKGPNLYEPIHGSAPDIAGQNKANPIAAILSAASMLRNSFGLEQEAQAVEAAVEAVLEAGFRTADLSGSGTNTLSTEQMAEEIKISMLGHEAITQIMGAYA
ncbi:3-isopropylmalate dehydrogenase [Peribacillus deserti]|uniref:3-isopropylmalate dehydrogenase n=1 Tax=Peribacillus deserti TaxID=673318 RepID=A0ABS2QHH8_9BACI|nr:3-isopropylmalate dehydrogenase [Peribacillus deserti]MBM7691973.1 3-isopropylmalate dehydrogenase [Peribacillus deserti]